MTDITALSLYELREDRAASLMDINYCEKMLPNDPTYYRRRADTNRMIVEKIDAELARRGTAEQRDARGEPSQ